MGLFLDNGAPTSITELNIVSRLCNAVGLATKLSLPSAVCKHGWMEICFVAMGIISTSYMRVMDIKNRLTVTPFDIIEGESKAIIALGEKCFANTLNVNAKSMLIIRRPPDIT